MSSKVVMQPSPILCETSFVSGFERSMVATTEGTVSKLRRNSVPAKMRLWVAMKHKERWAGTADQRPNSPLCCSDHTSLEARQELAVHVLKGCHAAKSDTL